MTGLADVTVTVGVLAPRGPEQAQAEWSMTMDYLQQALPGTRFQLRPAGLDGLAAAVANGAVDFVITHPGQFVSLGTPHALSWLATLRSRRTGSSRQAVGSVLLVRADSAFLHPNDLRGHLVGAVHPRAFGGYLLLLPQLLGYDILPQSAFRLRFFGFPIDQLIYQLRDGAMDAVIVPACLLEQMSAEGAVEATQFRSLLPNLPLGDCLSNTPAFPNWSFAALPHVSERFTRQVTRALLGQMEAGHSVWGAAISPAQIERLYHDLQLHPLQLPRSEQFRLWLQRYWPYGMAILLLLLAGLLRHLWLQRQALQHSRALAAAQLRLREREQELAAAQRWSLLGELAAGLAHELNQPLAAIRHYAEGCAVRLEQQDSQHPLLPVLERIDQEATRGAAIVRQTRRWLQSKPPQVEELELAELLQDLAHMQGPQSAKAGVDIVLELGAEPLHVLGNRLALEQVLTNLIANSTQAYQAKGCGGSIVIRAEKLEAQVVIRVRDESGGFSSERLREPFVPFRSTRRGGLGVGLLICQRLMLAQGGQLHLANAGAGAEVSLSLPVGAGV